MYFFVGYKSFRIYNKQQFDANELFGLNLLATVEEYIKILFAFWYIAYGEGISKTIIFLYYIHRRKKRKIYLCTFQQLSVLSTILFFALPYQLHNKIP